MVDVSGKGSTERSALAEGRIRMSAACFERIETGDVKKGDVLGTARIAGIMGAKKTSGLIPLCHNIPLSGVNIEFEKEPKTCTIRALCTVRCTGQTGVEMEALTGVSCALLTVYDMCKAIDRSMEISDIRLLHKEGGKSGVFDRNRQEEMK